MITEEQRTRAIRLYRNRELTIPEIANLTDLSTGKLSDIYREEFKAGRLKPRSKDKALVKYETTGEPTRIFGVGKGGRNKERKKFTDEQEQQIAQEYYELGFTLGEVIKKWGIHPKQMQRIRTKYGTQNKMDKRIRAVVQLDSNGQIIAEYPNGRQASLELGISYQCIYKCCVGSCKSAGGFVWKFKE